MIGSFLFLSFAPAASAAEPVFTDEEVLKSVQSEPKFKSVHTVMFEQRQNLRDLSDAFLYGDKDDVKVISERISKEMNRAGLELEQKGEDSSAAWSFIAQVVRQSDLMREAVSKDDYRQAYKHYQTLSLQCLQCHQAVRSWGKFEEPKPEGELTPEEKRRESVRKISEALKNDTAS